jgi:hypothetical protein
VRRRSRRNISRSIGFGVALLCLGCVADAGIASDPPADDAHSACESPRPELCAQLYDPVCGQRDTGVRCVTTPCNSTEPREYPNACEACADPKVLSYADGPC